MMMIMRAAAHCGGDDCSLALNKTLLVKKPYDGLALEHVTSFTSTSKMMEFALDRSNTS